MNKRVNGSIIFYLLVATFFLGGCNVGDMLNGGENKTEDTVWLDAGEVKGPTMIINSKKGPYTFDIEIADTFEERAKGLMNRNSMKDNYGMLFVFEEEKELSFWMKNTLIPLDMIYFDHDYKIVHIQKDAQPCKKDPCEVFPSLKSAKYVMEVKGGVTERLGISTGDTAVVNL